MATKKSATKSSSKRSSSSTKGRGKVQKVMHEYKHGTLKSGSGGKVKNPKQAIAIALSEAREAGAKIPKKRGSSKSASASRKSSSRTTKKSSGRATAKKKSSR